LDITNVYFQTNETLSVYVWFYVYR